MRTRTATPIAFVRSERLLHQLLDRAPARFDTTFGVTLPVGRCIPASITARGRPRPATTSRYQAAARGAPRLRARAPARHFEFTKYSAPEIRDHIVLSREDGEGSRLRGS